MDKLRKPPDKYRFVASVYYNYITWSYAGDAVYYIEILQSLALTPYELSCDDIVEKFTTEQSQWMDIRSTAAYSDISTQSLWHCWDRTHCAKISDTGRSADPNRNPPY